MRYEWETVKFCSCWENLKMVNTTEKIQIESEIKKVKLLIKMLLMAICLF